MKRGWYEVWADETAAIPYVVLLRPNARGFEVVDPKEGDITVFEAATYEDAASWLAEDEFVRLVRTEPVDDQWVLAAFFKLFRSGRGDQQAGDRFAS